MRAQHDFPVLVLTAHGDEESDIQAVQQLTAAADLDRHSHDLHFLPSSPAAAAAWPSIHYEPPTPPPLSAPAKRLSFVGAADTADPCFVRPRTPADRSTQHWLLNGRPPSKKPSRHRHKISLTLPLTVDCSSPIRSLTHDTPAAAVHDAEEDANMGPVPPSAGPGSVPELTESKSSKSSSFRSSDADEGAIPDLAHFEDIGLDDAPRRAADDPNKTAPQRPGLRRTSGPATVAGRNHAPAMRELVNGAVRSSPTPPFSPMMQPKAAPLRPGSMGARNSSPRPSARSQPGTPALGHPRMRHLSRSCSRTRSRSPAHQMQGPVPSSGGALPGSGPNSRRGSSVLRARKTAKELEQEYADMDGDDDELPDDASLWNVPMSPSLYRRGSTAVSSTQTSPRGSPERGSRPATPRPSRLRPIDAIAAQTTPVEPAPKTAPLEQSMKKPTPPRLEMRHSASDQRVPAAVQTPDRFTFSQSRTKSWDTVLSDLSEDAKHLSAALDTLHDQSAQHPHPSRKPDDSSLSSDPMPRTLARARTAPAVELPPLRKNNVMIDPLPISKEKEKVLSRTRPSWLPPKDRKEEKKHLREYQRMMERSQEAEKKRAALALAAAAERDSTRLALQKEWDSQIFPAWSTAIKTISARELWWRGIPARARPEAWRRGIGNELGVTATTFEKALARAQAQEQGARAREWWAAIDADLSVALPQLALFQTGQPLHATATSLLRAYAMYRSDIGYVTGIALPACLLLVVFGSAAEAFVALANLLNRSMPLAFLTSDRPAMQRVYGWVQELLVKQRPRLATHIFETQDLTPAEVLEPLLRSLFLNSSASEAKSTSSAPSTPLSGTGTFPTGSSGADASLATVLRLWDIFLLDPDAALVRIAAGVLVANEARLYGTADEIRAVVGWGGSLLRISSENDTSSLNGNGSSHEESESAAANVLAQCDALQWSDPVEAIVRHVRDVGRQPADEKKREELERKRAEKEEKKRRKKEDELPWQM